jgi:predicted peptidase
MKVPILSFSVAVGVMLCSASCTSVAQQGQHPQTFQKEIKKTIGADYLLYLPEGYETEPKDWPLILFLHGRGECGNDLSKVEAHGPPMLIAKKEKQFPFVIVSPQCPENEWWSTELQVDTLNALLDDVVSQYNIDQERIYVTGLSMGGFGSWSLAAAYPDRFAAIAPICGGGNPEDAASIAHLPVWVFHGEKDQAIPIKRSEEMVLALEKSACRVQFTTYPDAGHDSWTTTYTNPELYAWFLKHTRSDNENYKKESSPKKSDEGEGK